MIRKKCRQFAVDLLDECRTSEEVELLLRQDHDDKTSVQPGGQYPRLRMAIEWEIKEVSYENNQETYILLVIIGSKWDRKLNVNVLNFITVHHAQELPTSDAKHVDAISSRYNEDVFCDKVIVLHSPNDSFTFRIFGVFPVSLCKHIFLLECTNE